MNVSILFQIDSVDRLGVAAPISDILDLNLPEADSEEELLRKQKVAEFVSKLTPEQLKSQQERVQVRHLLKIFKYHCHPSHII